MESFIESLREFLTPGWLWFLAGMLLLIIEFGMPGLIALFFGIGAIVTAIFTWIFPIPLAFQLTIFLIVSVASLVLLRKHFKTIFYGYTKSGESESIIEEDFKGKRVVVTSDIAPGRPGKVEFQGTQWIAEADEEIAADSLVEIITNRNLSLYVKKV